MEGLSLPVEHRYMVDGQRVNRPFSLGCSKTYHVIRVPFNSNWVGFGVMVKVFLTFGMGIAWMLTLSDSMRASRSKFFRYPRSVLIITMAVS